MLRSEPPSAAVLGAMNVSERFSRFLSNVALTPDQLTDGATKHTGVRGCLNRYYYNTTSTTDNSMLVGSWGKDTRVRPPRDIDVLFVLPFSVYSRFQQRQGNKQAQLLQEMKEVLARTYTTTKMRADGQVVLVPFTTYSVEVVPAFALENSNQFWICDTNDGGRYKTADPRAEIAAVHVSNYATNGNTRDLIRMLKTWQRVCNVPLKSFVLELLAIQFLSTWGYRGKSTVYYDWMVRDFFAWLLKNYMFSWNGVTVPGTNEFITIGTDWRSRAESAHDRAVKACDYESNNMPCNASGEWQKIFGDDVPSC